MSNQRYAPEPTSNQKADEIGEARSVWFFVSTEYC